MSSSTSHASAQAKTAAKRRRPARRGEGGQLRSEIIDAANRRLAETGDASSLSLRSVARTVGVAATSIYLHFQDIGELVSAVKQRLFQQFTQTLTEVTDAAGDDPRERVHALSLAYVDFGLTHPGDYRVMFTPLSASVTEELSRQTNGAFAVLREAVAAAIGEVRADRVALHLWTALHGIVTLRELGSFPWPAVEEQVDDLLGLLFGPQGNRSENQPPQAAHSDIRDGTEKLLMGGLSADRQGASPGHGTATRPEQ
ncbi:WHG domain-containing protein [Streptomyces sp. NBC_01007]|nr:WHG domain-containing protein [Streptomyces sp. NBC_01007]WRZ95701.1 WHG domain-containing protein [Streptomyces sp. NBC_01007]